MALWLWLCCCCLAAWPAPGRSDTATALPAFPEGGGEQPLPPISADFSQHDILQDEISQEFLLQKIRESLGDDHQFPILVHGEPQAVPLKPRGRSPPCSRVGCTRKPPLYKLEDFPPGRPTHSNLGHLCAPERRKPSYGPWNLPQTSFSHLSRQGEAMNKLEGQFGHCCQLAEGEKLPCCTRTWEGGLMHFCKQEYSTKTRPFHCCLEASKQARLACFTNQAPFPAYDKEGSSLDMAQLTTPLLDSLCSQAPHQSKQRPSPALVQNITDSCCKLQESERTQCAEEVKLQFIATFCGSQKRSWKDPQKCCAQDNEAARSDCFNRSYLGHISLLSSEQAVPPTEATS
ncbi:extracellular matrix protein 1 [Candoia aspera]|uniref:extracellular matrix protein 1 n=1 Tax=Candoia aspera TaxID=51853 RepID=UPI002FD849E1